jgi:hypothetical protein
MAKVIEVSIRYTRKINLGNYSTMDLECAMTSTVEPDEPAVTVADGLFQMARLVVGKEAKEIIKDGKNA